MGPGGGRVNRGQVPARLASGVRPSDRAPGGYRYRYLIPATGFYEWAQAGTTKRPFHLRRKDQQPFAFAGLWDVWKGADGKGVVSCCLVTTAANDLVRPAHDRMPVILGPDAFARWLDPGAAVPDRLALLRPYPAEVMEAVPVGPAVNSPRTDGPECLEPAAWGTPAHADPGRIPAVDGGGIGGVVPAVLMSRLADPEL